MTTPRSPDPVRALTIYQRRLCPKCNRQIAVVFEKFVLHGKMTDAGRFTACGGSCQRPQKGNPQ